MDSEAEQQFGLAFEKAKGADDRKGVWLITTYQGHSLEIKVGFSIL